MKTYAVNEIFYSLQGEGVRAGEPSIFLRFAGCNMTCKVETHGFDCDTEFVSSRKLTADEILQELQALTPRCKWVIFTGGEPGLQVDQQLIDRLHGEGFQLAIETNGSIKLPDGIDWITVSPKVAEHAIRQLTAHEVKYVRGYGQAIPKTAITAAHYLISPAFSGTELPQKTMEWCVRLALENPPWRLSVQQHKVWRVR
jgi:7-carboxy-7-deazaguanine synthase